MGWLCLGLHPCQKLKIGKDITITVNRFRLGQYELAVHAPPNVRIERVPKDKKEPLPSPSVRRRSQQ